MSADELTAMVNKIIATHGSLKAFAEELHKKWLAGDAMVKARIEGAIAELIRTIGA